MALQDWHLECTNGAVPCVLRPSANEPTVLRLGRQVQGQTFWDRLVPDERQRMTISREHCEIRARGMELIVVNSSAVGTAVNGIAVHKDKVVHDGDLIGVGTHDPKGVMKPVVQFRLCMSKTGRAGDGAGHGEDFRQSRSIGTVSSNVPACSSGTYSSSRIAGNSAKANGSTSGSWSLRCIAVHGRRSSELQGLHEEACVLLPPSDPAACLKVGRAVQPLAFWETLIPDEMSRNKISREQFEVRHAAGGWTVVNHGTAGTRVNGKLMKATAALRPGDIIEIPFRPEEENIKLVTFRLEADGMSSFSTSPALPSLACVEPSGCRLSCVSVCGRSHSELQALAESARTINFVGNTLKVGRSHQLSFWEALVPAEKMRNKVSRDHFQVHAASAGFELVNVATTGTLLNGLRVKDKATLIMGDRIAIPSTAAPNGCSEEETVACFEIQATGSKPSVLTGSSKATSSMPPSRSGYKEAEVRPAGVPGHSASRASMPLGSGLCRDLAATLTPAAGREGLPAFELQVISSLGLSTVDLGFLPKEQRVWYPETGARSFRVGRLVQPSTLWSALIPDERCRNTISREHFEIVAESGPVFFISPSSSSSTPSQTLLNGQQIGARTKLTPMDVIGIGSCPADMKEPVMRLRFSLETGSVLASVTTMPNGGLAGGSSSFW